MFEGTPAELITAEQSLTAKYVRVSGNQGSEGRSYRSLTEPMQYVHGSRENSLFVVS